MARSESIGDNHILEDYFLCTVSNARTTIIQNPIMETMIFLLRSAFESKAPPFFPPFIAIVAIKGDLETISTTKINLGWEKKF